MGNKVRIWDLNTGNPMDVDESTAKSLLKADRFTEIEPPKLDDDGVEIPAGSSISPPTEGEPHIATPQPVEVTVAGNASAKS